MNNVKQRRDCGWHSLRLDTGRKGGNISTKWARAVLSSVIKGNIVQRQLQLGILILQNVL